MSEPITVALIGGVASIIAAFIGVFRWTGGRRTRTFRTKNEAAKSDRDPPTQSLEPIEFLPLQLKIRLSLSNWSAEKTVNLYNDEVDLPFELASVVYSNHVFNGTDVEITLLNGGEVIFSKVARIPRVNFYPVGEWFRFQTDVWAGLTLSKDGAGELRLDIGQHGIHNNKLRYRENIQLAHKPPIKSQ